MRTLNIALMGLLVATVVAGAMVTLVNTVRPSAAAPVAPSLDASRLKAMELRLLALENRLAEVADHLRPPSPADRPLPEGVTSRPLFEGTPTIGQHLSDLEGNLFDFEREIRRDLRNLYDALRRRLDEIENKGVPLRTAADSARGREELLARVKAEGITYDPALGEISFEAAVASPTRALELLVVTPGGRTHESLLVGNVGTSALNLAIRDLGLKEALDADFEQDLPPRGDSLVVYVTWAGRKTPLRIEALLKDGRDGKAFPRCAFAWTASRTFLDTKTFEDHLAADVYHHTIALSWKYNMDAILACGLKEARDENAYIPDSKTCPEPGTLVRVILRKAPVTEWEN